MSCKVEASNDAMYMTTRSRTSVRPRSEITTSVTRSCSALSPDRRRRAAYMMVSRTVSMAMSTSSCVTYALLPYDRRVLCPFTLMLPSSVAVCARRPDSAFSNVVLPQPDAPGSNAAHGQLTQRAATDHQGAAKRRAVSARVECGHAPCGWARTRRPHDGVQVARRGAAVDIAQQLAPGSFGVSHAHNHLGPAQLGLRGGVHGAGARGGGSGAPGEASRLCQCATRKLT